MRRQLTYLFLGLGILLHFGAKAQYPSDSVYKLAYLITGKQSFPLVNQNKVKSYPLSSDFSKGKTSQSKSLLLPLNKEITASLALANNYSKYIKEQLSANQLPSSYVYIPFVLSGMVNTFRDEHGRAGIWQLPYPVAVKEKLTISPYFDQRLDYKYCTHAAIHHLVELNNEFKDSTLALLAYFNGIGATKYAIQQAGSKELEKIYTHLPSATRDIIFQWNYISALLSHERNQLKEKFTPENMAALERVQVPKNTHLMAVGKKIDISSLTMKAINPTLIGLMLPADSYLKLPLGKKALFEQLQDSIYHYQETVVTKPKVYKPKKPTYTPPPKGSSKNYYTVRSGDNLGSIASKHKVHVSQLKSWNGLSNDKIYAGQKLIVWSKGKPKTTKTPPEKPKTTTSSDGKTIIYTVKSGDSLWGISQKYEGVSADDIQKWNNIGESIDIGQKLKIKVK